MTSIVQQHLKQQRPFRSAEEEVFLALQILADRLMEPWAAYLRDHADLTHVQYNVLRILRGAGATGLWAGEIGERLITRSPDVTRLVDRLARRGLVRRGRDPDDGRAVRIYITPAGRDLLAPLDQKSRTMIRDAFNGFPQERLEAMRNDVNELLGQLTHLHSEEP